MEVSLTVYIEKPSVYNSFLTGADRDFADDDGVIDSVTALDYVLTDPNTEAKFQALKALHTKKIKSLMGTIETQNNEITKLKTLGKDHRRTQIIQSMKKKLRDQELVSDVVKTELSKKCNMTEMEVNEFVIAKTISGPKRFRPLTRDELEKKIMELEKVNKVKPTAVSTSNNIKNNNTNVRASNNSTQNANNGNNGNGNNFGSAQGPDFSSTPNNANGPKGTTQYQNKNASNTYATNANNAGEEIANYLIKINTYINEINTLKQELLLRNNQINTLKEEIIKYRANTSVLSTIEDENDVLEKSLRSLNIKYNQLLEEYNESIIKISQLSEENQTLRTEGELENELRYQEVEQLSTQCEKLLKHNIDLLKTLSTYERESGSSGNKMISSSQGGGGMVKSPSRKSASSLHLNLDNSAGVIAELKQRIVAYESKLLHYEANGVNGGGASAGSRKEVNAVMDKLRERNEVVKEQSRTIREQQKIIAELRAQLSQAGISRGGGPSGDRNTNSTVNGTNYSLSGLKRSTSPIVTSAAVSKTDGGGNRSATAAGSVNTASASRNSVGKSATLNGEAKERK